MNIQNSTNLPHNNLNFKAIKIASVKNRVFENRPNIEIYQIRAEDYGFLQKLNSKVDYKKLCPKLSKELQERWQRVFEYCISKAFKFGNTTYLATENKRPCAIMTYFADRDISLDGICAIPDNKGRKVHLGGKSLFYQLFKDAEEIDVKDIKLDAITDGPFNVVKKYEALGFKNIGYKNLDENTLYAEMKCGKHKIKAQLKELPFELEYKQTFERAHLNDILEF